MDLNRFIRELREEKQRVDTVIAALESILNGVAAGTGSRRGRKSMSAEEKAEVSRRMKQYWKAQRRHKKDQPDA